MKQWYLNKQTQTFYLVEEASSNQELKALSLTVQKIDRTPKRNKAALSEVIDVVVQKEFILQDCDRLAKMKVPKKVRRALS